MKKLFQLRLTLFPIISGICFLGALIIGVPLIIQKIFWPDNNSILVTKYIFFCYTVFFLIFLGILVPVLRKFFVYLKIEKVNPFDIIATVILFIASFIPMIINFMFAIAYLKSRKTIPYKFVHRFISVTVFLLGTVARYHGKFDKDAKLKIMNHSSPLDYPYCALAMGSNHWTVMAGINLSRNTKSFEDKLVSRTVGGLLRDYAISVDRDEKSSRINAVRKTITELENGKFVAVFPEGGRTTFNQIKNNGDVLNNFQDGTFRTAWEHRISIQPIVLDWPIIWRGKDDQRWGIRPCIVDIHYLQSVDPSNFKSIEEFKNACWMMMYFTLCESEKVHNFLGK
jgi:1-acyl-sn-glycerol-3-phosphate acyltransferase